MTLTQFLLIMVQTNFPFVLTIKEMILLSNNYNLSHLNMLLLFKRNSKNLLKRTTKSFINNLFYSMTLILQAMTKIKYILEFHIMTLLFHRHLQENYPTLRTSPSSFPQESTSAINVQTNSPSLTHCSQTVPFYDTSFFKYKN